MGNDLWWHGPDFLSSNCLWPQSFREYLPVDHLPEVKNNTHALITTHASSSYLLQTQSKYSTFLRLQRIVAFMLRFICNCRNQLKLRGPLSATEYQNATKTCVKIVQLTHYATDLKTLEKGIPVTKSLSPFLEKGVIKVGGRLKYAPLSETSKHPMILPKHCHLSLLICNHFHRLSCHGGTQLTQSLIRRQFWICSCRSLLSQQIGKYLT